MYDEEEEISGIRKNILQSGIKDYKGTREEILNLVSDNSEHIVNLKYVNYICSRLVVQYNLNKEKIISMEGLKKYVHLEMLLLKKVRDEIMSKLGLGDTLHNYKDFMRLMSRMGRMHGTVLAHVELRNLDIKLLQRSEETRLYERTTFAESAELSLALYLFMEMSNIYSTDESIFNIHGLVPEKIEELMLAEMSLLRKLEVEGI